MQNVVVTGAGRGLGLALTEAYARAGARVVAGYRSLERSDGLTTLAVRDDMDVVPVVLDVRKHDSFELLARQVKATLGSVDLLLNNAGVNADSFDCRPRSSTWDLEALQSASLRTMFEVNAIGPLLITRALLPMLKRGRSPRVVNLSSRRGSLQQNACGGNYGYKASKSALNMFTRALANDLRPHGITVVAVHPGCVKTDMGVPEAEVAPATAAAEIAALASALTPADGGRFLRLDHSDHPW